MFLLSKNFKEHTLALLFLAKTSFEVEIVHIVFLEKSPNFYM